MTLNPELLQEQSRCIAHEIRNQVSICDVYCEIIKKHLEKDGIKNESISKAVDCIQKSVKIINNSLIELKSVNNYSPQNCDIDSLLEQSISLSKVYIHDKKIDIIRVGLQSTDEIADPSREKSEVVAGPYHPAFRQLVESAMWYDAIVGKIKKLNVKVKEVEVKVNPIDANNVIGHKKENAKKLKEFGANIFVAGTSSIFHKDGVKADIINQFRNVIGY